MSDNTPNVTPEAEATATTSPIVTLAWTGLRFVAAPPSQAKIGYTHKAKAKALTITRANGATDTRKGTATKAEAECLLRKAQRDAILALVAEKAKATLDAWTKANPKADAEAITKAQAEAITEARDAIYANGSVTFAPTVRAQRTPTLDDTDDIAGMLA